MDIRHHGIMIHEHGDIVCNGKPANLFRKGEATILKKIKIGVTAPLVVTH